jgi:hypothetical protein
VYLDAYKAQNLEGAYWKMGCPYVCASVPIFEMPHSSFFMRYTPNTCCVSWKKKFRTHFILVNDLRLGEVKK